MHTGPALSQELSVRHIGGGRLGGNVRHRLELSTSSSYCCCCEPELDSTILILLESRHDVPDSPSTLCIRVASPLAWGRNNLGKLRAQRRHVLWKMVAVTRF